MSGVYAGACVSMAAVDLQLMRAVPEPRMAELFKAMLVCMGRLMVPQLVVMLVLLAITFYPARRQTPLWRQVPILIFSSICAITLAVHIPINQSFLTDSVAQSDVVQLIQRWEYGHWLRTALAIALPVSIARNIRLKVGATTPGADHLRASACS